MSNRFLLDTTVMVWWLQNSSQLPPAVRLAIANADEVLVSAASGLGVTARALAAGYPAPNAAEIKQALRRSKIGILGATLEHMAAAAAMEGSGALDLVERIMVAQARENGLTVITTNPAFRQAGIAAMPI